VSSGTDEASELGSHEMNFLPRSVAMGNSTNKFVKLHVKFESGKETFSVPPDLSVGVLKEQIAAKFQVPVSQLVLSCNGKPLVGEEGRSLRQARVCSGSKVLAARAGARQEAVVQGPAQPRDQEEEQRRGQIRREVEAGEREQELVTRLVAVLGKVAGVPSKLVDTEGSGEDVVAVLQGLLTRANAGSVVIGTLGKTFARLTTTLLRLGESAGREGELEQVYLGALQDFLHSKTCVLPPDTFAHQERPRALGRDINHILHHKIW